MWEKAAERGARDLPRAMVILSGSVPATDDQSAVPPSMLILLPVTRGSCTNGVCDTRTMKATKPGIAQEPWPASIDASEVRPLGGAPSLRDCRRRPCSTGAAAGGLHRVQDHERFESRTCARWLIVISFSGSIESEKATVQVPTKRTPLRRKAYAYLAGPDAFFRSDGSAL
jgi:hypothetical protein